MYIRWRMIASWALGVICASVPWYFFFAIQVQHSQQIMVLQNTTQRAISTTCKTWYDLVSIQKKYKTRPKNADIDQVNLASH